MPYSTRFGLFSAPNSDAATESEGTVAGHPEIQSAVRTAKTLAEAGRMGFIKGSDDGHDLSGSTMKTYRMYGMRWCLWASLGSSQRSRERVVQMTVDSTIVAKIASSYFS